MSIERITQRGPYLWEHATWPEVSWDGSVIADRSREVLRAIGLLEGKATALGFERRLDVEVDAVVEEAVTTASIEGERLQRDSVRSSVARHLGLPTAGLARTRRPIEGLVQVLLDARHHPDVPLTRERLFGWHASLFPGGRSGMDVIDVGAWRRGTEPMRVVSGLFSDRPRVHFEAPPSPRVPAEMDAFLAWFAAPGPDVLVHAALAHLHFVTVHPFDDGNGRLARAVTDLALARLATSGPQVWSLSARIQQERETYYRLLEETQRGSGDVTAWLMWHLELTGRAVADAEQVVNRVLAKVRFWDDHRHVDLNPRQRKVLNRLLDAGPGGFEGGMSTRKAASLTGASRATAQRDLAELRDHGILEPLPGGGRSAAYALVATVWAGPGRRAVRGTPDR